MNSENVTTPPEDEYSTAKIVESVAEHMRQHGQWMLMIGGIMGAGKSSTAKALPQLLQDKNIAVVDIDDIVTTKNPKVNSRKHMWKELFKNVEVDLSKGINLIVTATFRDPKSRQDFTNSARKHNAAFLGLWINIDEDVALNTCLDRVGHPDSNDPECLEKQKAWLREFHKDGGIDAVTEDGWLVANRDQISQILSSLS